MRVTLNLESCEGHGMCAVEAPRIFALDPQTKRVVLLQESPDEAQRQAVSRAVRHCPTFALGVED